MIEIIYYKTELSETRKTWHFITTFLFILWDSYYILSWNINNQGTTKQMFVITHIYKETCNFKTLINEHNSICKILWNHKLNVWFINDSISTPNTLPPQYMYMCIKYTVYNAKMLINVLNIYFLESLFIVWYRLESGAVLSPAPLSDSLI